LAGGSVDGAVRVWASGSGSLAQVFNGPRVKADPVAFLADGRLVTGSSHGTLRVWRLPHTPAVPVVAEGDQPPAALRFLDGQRMLVGSMDGTLACWDRLRDRLLWSVRMPSGSVQALALDPRRERVYSAGRDGQIRIWRARDGVKLAEVAGEGSERLALAVSADLLASGGKDGTVQVRQAASGARVRNLPRLGDWVGALDFSPDGRMLAALTVSGGLRLWDTRTWKELLAVQGTQGRSMRPVTLAFAPGGESLAVGAWDKGVDLLDARTGKWLSRLEGQDGWGWGAWTPDGRRFVSASLDGRFRVWDPATGSPLLTLPLPEGQLQAMALAPDGRSVVLGGLALHTWDAE
jgi:WD40 repeat protein